MALIELAAIARHYRHGDIDVAALDGVSLSIEAGEFVAIIGQSGSGKSTLMNVLGCLDNPTGGHYRLAGQDISDYSADELAALRREHFGFIFQRYHLLPHLDALDNVALPAIYVGEGSETRHARARALLERLGLADRLRHRPNALSGGQQQRVSIARALMNGGQIILADEPTGALDSTSGAELLALLAELNAKGHTVIIVTHDAHVAAHARRVIELRDGRLQRDSGTPAAGSPIKQTSSSINAMAAGRLYRRAVQWRESIRTAWAALRGNRLRSALSMLGISIGIASVVSIVAVTDAVRASIDRDMRSFISGRIDIWRGNPQLPPGAEPMALRTADMEAIRALPGVKGIDIRRESPQSARVGSRSASVGVIAADMRTLTARKLKVVEGRYLNTLDDAESAQVAVIDDKARLALGVPGQSLIGKVVLLGSPSAPAAGASTTTPTGAQAAPEVTVAAVALPFIIVGVVAPDTSGMGSFGSWNGQVLIPSRTYGRKLDARTDADNVSVLIDYSVPPADLRNQIVHRLKALHGREDFGVWNGEEEYRQIRNATAAMAAGFAGVGAIALLVGGVGVMNIMLVSVSERTREIGIRMAVGARQSDVRLQFLIEAVVLCCLGGVAGIALGWMAAFVVNLIQTWWVVQISATAILLAFAVASGVGLVFGTLPARRAAALSPVDALARE